MDLHTQIKDEIKTALKAKDEVRLRTVRSILTACTNELVATGKTPQHILDDANTLSVIKRLAKQRKESIAQFESAGRDDLAVLERDELIVLEAYLPQMMSRDQIIPIVRAKIDELKIVDPTKKGVLIGILMRELNGKADGTDVRAIVEDLLL